MSFNDVEITPKGGKLRYEAIIDDCKVRLDIEKVCIYCYEMGKSFLKAAKPIISLVFFSIVKTIGRNRSWNSQLTNHHDCQLPISLSEMLGHLIKVSGWK